MSRNTKRIIREIIEDAQNFKVREGLGTEILEGVGFMVLFAVTIIFAPIILPMF